ncbi:MAG: N-acetylmuramoyl-L-alanine amidase, partial [Actinomycetota bacterium]|nr:N-acetylmuramoyl-L-alanine amidase [Actinomycetota bacterium]
SFVDDDTSIHQGAIEAIAAATITRGCNPPANTRFCPDEPVTRGEMAAFLVRALGLPTAEAAGFTDAADSIFAIDIDRIAGAHITRGCNPPANDQYCPDTPVTRGQLAAFLSRALDLAASDGDSFVDDDGSVFEPDIERLRLAGITLGCNPPGNDRFCPERNVTRAEMATFLSRALSLDPVEVSPRPIAIDVVGRDQWGAAPQRGGFIPHEIEQITIHHAGTVTGAVGPAQFRGWQSYHLSIGWPDLAYHFIVGRDGNIYEGRPYGAVGDTATSYDPAGHFLIVVEGNFDNSIPNEDQIEMLSQMVAWASMQFDVPVSTIAGHRDHAATTCPGDNLYTPIHDGTIADRAAEIVTAGGATLFLND